MPRREAGTPQSNIDLQIDELIMHGIPPLQRKRVAAAVRRELLRILSEQGLPPSFAESSDVPHIAIDGLQLQAGAKPGAIGTQIAQAVYANLPTAPVQK